MIFNYESLEEFLKDELRRRVKLNPNYSLRSFARNLNVSPGALSEILRGRRELSIKSVPAVAKAIGLNAVEGRHLLKLAQTAKANKDKGVQQFDEQTKTRDEFALNSDLFSLISEWYHFAILNLIDCQGFKWEAPWIARRLGISRIQAKMGMELLLRIGLVENLKGQFKGRNSQIVAKTEIPSSAIRQFHRQILEKATLALEAQSLAEREFVGCGFAFDPSQIAKIKKDLNDFHDELIAKYSKGRKTEVYFLETALFKLTEGEGK